ncbi:MAG: hypothetical protein HOH43_22050 [Candidatus Latescibacteria bacterium]|nr:hypothetical protein [Candidatus Latescibacterota bacterium]
MTCPPIIKRLSDYQVDPQRGFLPARSPISQLPEGFSGWDQLAARLSDLLIAGRYRSAVDRLSIPDTTRLETEAQLQRAMLLLSVFGNSYIWGGPETASVIPRALAVPWAEVAERLGRPMIISHASIVLNNWYLLDETKALDLSNMGTRQLFLGGMDEAWFYLTTVAIEAKGAPALPELVNLKAAVVADAPEKVTDLLGSIALVIESISDALSRIPERCAPYVFYHRVRPFLAGWKEPGVLYEGVYDTPRVLAGGSAAQSSLLQAIDAGLSIVHEDNKTRPFLMDMRRYMPPAHRRFIEDLAGGPSTHEYVNARAARCPALRQSYNACVTGLTEFRRRHMEITVRYITHLANSDEGTVGTGGTDFLPFLKQARTESQQNLID